MKHQYFGDVNDYLKYGLLRGLADAGLSLAVCWMLTPGDGRNDGNRIGYLRQADRWRCFDPPLFDALAGAFLNGGDRSLALVEKGGLIGRASFHSAVLQDAKELREQYFAALSSLAKGMDIVFFDQDNGLEVPSVKKGQKRSSKYLYWDEVEHFYLAGHSLVLYQHFRRTNRAQFVSDIGDEMRKRTGAPWVYTVVTKHVAFLIVPQKRHEQLLDTACRATCRKWAPHMTTGLLLDNQ